MNDIYTKVSDTEVKITKAVDTKINVNALVRKRNYLTTTYNSEISKIDSMIAEAQKVNVNPTVDILKADAIIDVI